MNRNLLKGTRISKGISMNDMADALGLTRLQYQEREYGRTKFSDNEKIAVCIYLGFSFSDFNNIFFDGKLPF